MSEYISKPTFIELNRSYPTQYDTMNYEFNITMEDGREGIFTTTKENQTKFTLGKEVKYTVERKTDKKGNSFDKINIAKETFSGGGGGNSKGKDSSILGSVCLEMANVVVEKLGIQENILPDLKSLHALANKFYVYIEAKSGNDVQLRINYQSRLKEVCNYFFTYPNLNIKNSTQILEYVDIEVEYLQNKGK